MGNPASWSQATWFIDPQNISGTASDANSGIDATHAVLSYNGGVAAKWGTFEPILAQNTTMTWLSSQPAGDGDPVVLKPYMQRVVLTITATLGASQQVHSGTLASVTAKNRATPQLLKADLGYAATGGDLIQNTTHSSIALVYKNVSGTIFSLSQPMAPQAMPMGPTQTFTPVNTWANGDSFAAYNLISVNIAVLQPTLLEYDDTDVFPSQIQVKNIRLTCGNGAGNSNVFVNNHVSFAECVFDSFLDITVGGDDQFISNCYNSQGIFDQSGGNVFTAFFGGIIITAIGDCCISGILDYDIILDATPGGTPIAFGSQVNTSGNTAAIGTAYIAGTLAANGCVGIRSGLAYSGTFILWGTGTLDAQGSARIVYGSGAGAAATIFKNTGGLKLNGQTTCAAFKPSTGAWKTLTLTPANLDTAYSSGGFGGMATNPGGASISNQQTP